jgi:predicted nucleic-acid-binding Zn-ribbon protein
MSEMEVKTCPKCGGKMAEGKLWSYGGIRIGEEGSLIGWTGSDIRSFYCKNCGYIELYMEKKK